ncbi:MAG TPA: amidohydrolase family protein [Acidimicrobiales bacterium]|jgi:5-methylthioadenosine/S-adenosylhomocysteine deaminase|nr:amidohydrolase family protein [Acidimicrobiales bacterium]
MTLRLEADAVFTVDSADTVLAPGAVEIEDGRISWVGDPWQEPPASGTEVRRLGGLLLPGLVNCHGHTPMSLLRSAGDGLPLERWLHEAVWPREGRLEDEDVYWGMLLGASELLCNGVTTTCEQYRHPGAVVDAVLAAGIRTLYTPAIFDVPEAGPDNTWEALLGVACEQVDANAGTHERLQMGFGPHAAYTVPPQGLRTIAAEARARHALLQIHLSETAAECRAVAERYGMSAPALLASEGVLEGRVLAAHAVWLDDADLALLAEHDVAVAHCPGSNGKLGSGIAPLRALLDRGVRVGLGTDGPASNDDLHLWDELRLAPILARAVAGDPGVLTSAAALRLATRGGGEALGLPVGALEPGRPADLIRLRTDDARFTPALSDDELLGHLVWAGAGYLVTDVWVGGDQLVEQGRCTTVDADRARAEVGRRARRLVAP